MSHYRVDDMKKKNSAITGKHAHSKLNLQNHDKDLNYHSDLNFIGCISFLVMNQAGRSGVVETIRVTVMGK